MTDTYLHGIDHEEAEAVNLTITDADTSKVCVIGTKPTYYLENSQKIAKVTNFQESAKYVGNNFDGFTLPDACETILTESGGAEIYTINIFDTAKHLSSKENQALSFTNGECYLEEAGVKDLVLKSGNDTLEVGEDYEFDKVTGCITLLQNAELNNITGSYSYADFSKITDNDVIGTTDSNGNRTGIQAIWDIVSEEGVIPGIIIAPGFTSKNVRTALETMAEKFKSFTYPDTEPVTEVSNIESARLNPQTIDNKTVDLTSTSEYSTLCEGLVERYNSYQNTSAYRSLSPVVAGMRVKLDRDRSVAKSIDNTVSKTIKSRKFKRSYLMNDRTTDVQRINKTGMLTTINHKGAYYVFGGRNSSFITKNGIKTFEAARRVINFIEHSIEDSAFVCVGETITRGFIDDVLNSINKKFADWSNPTDPQHQILLDGEAYWDESLNTAESLADGHIIFPYKFCMAPTVEHITFKGILDVTIITQALANS